MWCISVCSYDVDVDLLFQENSTIGQKMFVLALCSSVKIDLFEICITRVARHMAQFF